MSNGEAHRWILGSFIAASVILFVMFMFDRIGGGAWMVGQVVLSVGTVFAGWRNETANPAGLCESKPTSSGV